MTDGNKIKVHRIVAATDPGYAVNPAQIERQIAGSFVYGLSALFYGGCTVKDGRIEQTNFDTYNSMRIAEMPKVEVDRHAERRLLGRRRRADDLRRGAGRAQRLFRGDRQAHPLGAAEATRTSPSPDERAAASRPPLASPGFCPWTRCARMTRRDVVRGIAAAAAALTLPCAFVRTIRGARRRDRRRLWRRQLRPRAEADRSANSQVTLVEPNRTFTACPFSNDVIAGLRSIEAQQFGYDRSQPTA